MTDNVGLSTPRGSGTSGYVQRNLAFLKPRDQAAPYPPRDADLRQHRQRQPDQGILEHDRKREVEVKVFELRDQLEEEEWVSLFFPPPFLLVPTCMGRFWLTFEMGLWTNRIDEDEIEKRCDELRKKLLEDLEKGIAGPRRNVRSGLKMHQVHELADAKIQESERLRQALKISKDYQEGSHWRRQEERLKKSSSLQQQQEEEEKPEP
jgi:hypothetical protein